MARPNDATRRITITIYAADGTTVLGTTTRTIYAAGLWNTQTIAITGDVVGQGTTDFADGAGLTFGVTLQNDTVGTDNIKVAAVTLNKIASSAMTSVATAGDSKLITSGGVRTEIDNALLNRGIDYGPRTPAQINGTATGDDAARNITGTIPTGSTVHVIAAGTIADGYKDGEYTSITVREGEDLRYYSEGNVHGWYTLDAEFKLKQDPVTSSDFAEGGDTSDFKFVSSVTQDSNGNISVTIKTIPLATPSTNGSGGKAGLMSAADKEKVNGLDDEITASDVTTAWNAWTPST